MKNYYYINIDKVNFRGIKYRKIDDSIKYEHLRREVEKKVDHDIVGAKIEIDNCINDALFNKDVSLSINFPLASMFASAIISFFISYAVGLIHIPIGFVFMAVIIYIFLCMWLLVWRARNVHRLRYDSVLFFETIKKIIEHLAR